MIIALSSEEYLAAMQKSQVKMSVILMIEQFVKGQTSRENHLLSIRYRVGQRAYPESLSEVLDRHDVLLTDVTQYCHFDERSEEKSFHNRARFLSRCRSFEMTVRKVSY